MKPPEPSLAAPLAADPGAVRPAPAFTAARRQALTTALPSLLVACLVCAFTAWFALYSIRLHDAHLTHKADLGQIDQAIWNTAHGRFVQEIKGTQLSTRLTDHVEPIFAPLSLIFYAWDDVRALLAVQALALGLGAAPLYLLARRRLATWAGARIAAWAAAAVALAYLLAPALQAAAVAEFHALALAPPLIGWALWALERRQWVRFVVAAVLVMAVQEGLALLGATLGLYAALIALATYTAARRNGDRRLPAGLGAGVGVLLLGLAWFYATTFVIIPHFAAQAYGVAQTPYAARYGVLGDSFGDVIKSLLTRPGLVLRVLAEPLRVRYLLGLLAPTGFLALLAPEFLALALPLLLANALSAFPFQYSGELHYSAPLAPYFAIAGAVGLARLAGLRPLPGRKGAPGSRRAWPLLFGCTLTVAGALAVQVAAGYTPAGGEFWRRGAEPWPAVTGHAALLERFLAQIPAGAPASATTDLFPHLSHRQLLYQFPDLGQAQWALVDVTGVTDRHPQAIKDQVNRMLREGWGIADAADGYVLLRQGQGQAGLPDSFYDFARGGSGQAPRPQHALDVSFGAKLRLTGYDVLDEPKWRRTALRFYWEPLAPLPADLQIRVQMVAPDGSPAADTQQTPMPALLWYPPGRWAPGEAIVTQGPAWYLPAAWAPLVEVAAGAETWTAAGCQAPGSGASRCLPDGRFLGPAVYRVRGNLAAQAGMPAHYAAADARFAAGNWGVNLAGRSLPDTGVPGQNLPVTLSWTGWPGPADRDYTVFLHLRDAAGRTVANADATPTYYVAAPTNRWPAAGQPGPGAGWDGTDVHSLALPANLPPGTYNLVAGWYDWQTGERLPRIDRQGNTLGDEFVLGSVSIDPALQPQPDLACLLARAACASQ